MIDDLRSSTTLVFPLGLLWTSSDFGENTILRHSTLAKSQLRIFPSSLIQISFLIVVCNTYYLCFDQSAVTGEHTCMLLKPLKNDELEVNESDELGFFTPFYKGLLIP